MLMTKAVPEPKMIEVVERVAIFMETLDDTWLDSTFAKSDVTIIENFAPFVFKGSNAVGDWAEKVSDHTRDIVDLRHSFDESHDFSVDGDRVFFTLRTTWTGTKEGVFFSEEGGWSFVLVGQSNDWRVQSYGWAVTDISFGELVK